MLSDFMAKQMRCSDNCETVLLPAGLIYFTVLFFFFAFNSLPLPRRFFVIIFRLYRIA